MIIIRVVNNTTRLEMNVKVIERWGARTAIPVYGLLVRVLRGAKGLRTIILLHEIYVREGKTLCTCMCLIFIPFLV